MFWAAIVITLASIFNHLYLTYLHYKVKLGLDGTPSFCNINAQFNCETVAASSYSAVAGIPVAAFGAAAHLILLVLLCSAFWNLSSDSKRVARWTTWLALFMGVVSVVMAGISSFAVGSWCLFCMLAYVLSWANLFAIIKLFGKPNAAELGGDIGALFSSQKWVLVMFIAIPALGWFGNRAFMDSYGLNQIDSAIKDSVIGWQSRTPSSFTEEGLILGDANAKMTIVEFADFLCPHCKHAAPTIHTFVKTRPGVRFIFKPFPLDGACNPAITQKGDGTRCVLTAAVMCAEKLGQKGWAVHDWIFERQESFYAGVNADGFSSVMNTNFGLDNKAMKECMTSEETNSLINRLATEGKTANIEGTPTVFVNNKKLERGQMMPVLDAVHAEIR